MRALNLNDAEMRLYQHHLDRLHKGDYRENPDGTVSTVLQTDWGGNGEPVINTPSLFGGVQLEGDALRAAVQPFQKWPVYPTSEIAKARYDAMHKLMELDVMPRRKRGLTLTSTPHAGL
jgi:hypothetical protein